VKKNKRSWQLANCCSNKINNHNKKANMSSFIFARIKLTLNIQNIVGFGICVAMVIPRTCISMFAGWG